MTNIAFFILLVALNIAPGCQCRREQIIVSNAVLEIPHSISSQSDEVSREKLADLVRGVIEVEPNFYFDKKNHKGKVLKITITEPSSKGSVAILMATLLPGEQSVEEIYRAYADIALQNGGIKGEDIKTALNEALKELYNLHHGIKPSNEYYLEKISRALNEGKDADSDLISAVGMLGEHRENKAVPLLIKLLQSTEDLALGNACMQALGEIGAGEAMPAIIEFAERKPPIIRRQAIIAAKKLGTKLAAEWLLVMSLGYDDATTRKEAADALAEVEAKLSLNKD